MDFSMQNELVNELLAIEYAHYTSGKQQISFRCPYCLDSNKHHDSTHFYVKVRLQNGELPVFYCQLCHSKGILDKDGLRLLGIGGGELTKELTKYNTAALKLTANRAFRPGGRFDTVVPLAEDNELNRAKLGYVNKRLGLDLGFEDLVKLKINLSLEQLLRENKINRYTMSEKMLNALNKYYLGFVSSDNAYINNRLLVKDDSLRRYMNYNIYGQHENSKRFYTIPNQVDIMNPKPINLIVSEGPFDNLSVYHNVFDGLMDDTMIYTSICGSGFMNIIQYFIKYGFIDVNIEIFADSEVPLSYYKKLNKQIKHLTDYPVFVNYNNAADDFGHPKDKIDRFSKRL